jgi:hypothetical protein
MRGSEQLELLPRSLWPFLEGDTVVLTQDQDILIGCGTSGYKKNTIGRVVRVMYDNYDSSHFRCVVDVGARSSVYIGMPCSGLKLYSDKPIMEEAEKS